MNEEYESHYHSVEEQHWWFVARRHMVWSLIQELHLPPTASVLEIGCSGGPLLLQLRQAGYLHLTGIDVSSRAIATARQRGLADVHVMDGTRLEFADNAFDLIIASDVLEHIDDEAAALREWHRVLRPGGRLLVFVPAHSFLWSQHDVVNHHYRRYSGARLRQVLQQHHFQLQRFGFWNNLLFFPTAAVRLLQRWWPARSKGDLQILPRPLNQGLLQLLKAENRLSRTLPLPFGVSVFACVTPLQK